MQFGMIYGVGFFSWYPFIGWQYPGIMQHHGFGVWLLTSHKWQRKGVLNNIGGWLSLVLPHHIKSFYQGFTGDITRSNDTCPSLVAIIDLQCCQDTPLKPTNYKQHVMLNMLVGWLNVCSLDLPRIILEKGQALCVARKIQMAFKHYPSTCSNTCAGPVSGDFPDDEP